MEARWLFTGFDWGRFRELTPRLRALGTEDGADLSDVDGAEEMLEELGDDAEPKEARNALIMELCTVGDGALFEHGLPELVSWLRRQPPGEEPAGVLAELISASPGVEEWFAYDSGVVGLLTIEENSQLARALELFRREYRPPDRPRGIAALTRHFLTSEPAVEHLDDLIEVVHESAGEMLGLAAIRVS